MTPQELAAAEREFLIRSDKWAAVRIVAEFARLRASITDYLTANLQGAISIARLEENSFLEDLLEEIDTALRVVKNPFTRIVARNQQRVINFAADSLNRYLLTSIFSPDAPAIKKLIGRVQSGTTLAKFFDRLAPVVRMRAKETLIEGFAAGESSAAIARRLGAVSDLARHRVLTIARTETNEAYRAAAREFYAGAEIREYIWMSVLDARTCLVCWHLHGRRFKSSKKVFSHPNCRCTLIPKTKNAPEIPTGAELFEKLEKGVQKQILGEKRFEIFRAGGRIDHFVGNERSTDRGDRYFIKSLTDLD